MVAGRISHQDRGAARLGCRSIIDDAQFYDYLKLFAAFVQAGGYAGLINIDEMGVFSHRLNSSQARTANYEVLLRILNDCLQGNVTGLGFLFGGTNTFLEDRLGASSVTRHSRPASPTTPLPGRASRIFLGL